MNIFRFFGDLSHLVSILILIYTMRERRSSAGISFKSQCLYTAVFVTRYLGMPPIPPRHRSPLTGARFILVVCVTL
jgi:hypothetical protein